MKRKNFWAYLSLPFSEIVFWANKFEGKAMRAAMLHKGFFDWSESSPRKWYGKFKIMAPADCVLCILGTRVSGEENEEYLVW